MKLHIKLLVPLMLVIMVFPRISSGEQRQELSQKEEKQDYVLQEKAFYNQPNGKFYKEFLDFFIEAVKADKEKDEKKLKKIESEGIRLIQNDSSVRAIISVTLREEGFLRELSPKNKGHYPNLMIAWKIAQMLKLATGDSFSMDMVASFIQQDLYRDSNPPKEEENKKASTYENILQIYNEGLLNFQEKEFQEVEANCLQRVAKWFKDHSEYKMAKELYEESLAIYIEIKNKLGEATCLLYLGDINYFLNQYENALEMYEKSSIIFNEIKKRSDEVYCLERLGNLYYALSEYEKASEIYKKSLVIYRQTKDRFSELNCLKRLGDIYQNLYELDKAQEMYEECLVMYNAGFGLIDDLKIVGKEYQKLFKYGIKQDICKDNFYIDSKSKARFGKANCLKDLGNIYRVLSNYEKAKDYLEESLSIFLEFGLNEGEITCLYDLTDVYCGLGEFEKAEKTAKYGIDISQKLKYPFGEAGCLQNLGDIYRLLSQYEKSKEKYEQSIAIYQELKCSVGEANGLESMSELYGMLGDLKKAQEMVEKALVIFRQQNELLGESNSLFGLGNIYALLSENEKALDTYEQALAISRKIKNRLGEANILRNIGEVCMNSSKYKNAMDNIELALSIYREMNYSYSEANCLHTLGDLNRKMFEYKKAQQYYNDAICIDTHLGARYGLGWSHFALGKTYESMSKFPDAEKEYMNSIDTIENVLEEIKHEELKSSYLSSQISPYEVLISLLFKQGKGKQAFSFAERSKSRSFLYLLRNKRFDIKKGVPLNLIRQEEELRQKIAGLTVQIEGNEKKEQTKRFSNEKLNEITKELEETRKAHDEIIDKIKFQCPEYADLIAVNPLSLEQIQTLIRESGDTVFLEYYTTKDATYLWVLDGKEISPYKINIGNNALIKRITEFYEMMSNPGQFNVETLSFQAQELYNLLLKPAENHWKEKKQIGIIPHGILHNLPFEALMNKGKFLEEQSIHFFYLPSSSVYTYCREKNSLTKEQFIAFGNPDGSLSFSEEEVKELKRLYPKDTEIFTGQEAKESRVGYYGPYADILHFSCHGEYDASNPLHSALKLGADNNADGRLEVQEIFQLNLKPAYLVTLSACDTNVGKIRDGDEIIGMSRAFMYAGTPSVLASLWKVNDYYTEKLMVSFYRELKVKNKIEALHSARMEMINSGKRHPYYWAPFVLIGDFR